MTLFFSFLRDRVNILRFLRITNKGRAILVEYINLNQEHLVKIQQGNKILITGASGGVGTALLDLGKLKGLKMYGTASKQKHEIIERYEANPISENLSVY